MRTYPQRTSRVGAQRISCPHLSLSHIFLRFAAAGELRPSRSAPTLMLMRNDLCHLVIGLASAFALIGAPGPARSANIDWPAYLGDKERSLYSTLQQINRSNVAQL